MPSKSKQGSTRRSRQQKRRSHTADRHSKRSRVKKTSAARRSPRGYRRLTSRQYRGSDNKLTIVVRYQHGAWAVFSLSKEERPNWIKQLNEYFKLGFELIELRDETVCIGDPNWNDPSSPTLLSPSPVGKSESISESEMMGSPVKNLMVEFMKVDMMHPATGQDHPDKEVLIKLPWIKPSSTAPHMTATDTEGNVYYNDADDKIYNHYGEMLFDKENDFSAILRNAHAWAEGLERQISKEKPPEAAAAPIASTAAS